MLYSLVGYITLNSLSTFRCWFWSLEQNPSDTHPKPFL